SAGTIGSTASSAAISAASSASWATHTAAVAGWTRTNSASRNRSPAGAGRCTAPATADGTGTLLTSRNRSFPTLSNSTLATGTDKSSWHQTRINELIEEGHARRG